MKFSAATFVSASFASVVAGQGCSTKPVGEPAGNPISRPLTEIIAVGTPFTITWKNTTTGFVNIELLRGPSTNVVPIQCLVERISNIGTYVWTPSPSLEADVSRYGLRIVDSETGQYQYSNQFGISNDAVHPPYPSVAPTTSQIASQATDGQVQVPITAPAQTVTTSIPVVANTTTTPPPIVTPTTVANSSVIIATTHIPISLPSGSGSGTGVPHTMAILQPTKNMTVPASLYTSKTASPTRVTASASASFVSSSLSGTGSPIAEATGPSAPSSGAGRVLVGSLLAGLGAMAAFLL
ncbi:MAG: hypothetical protein Q9173_001641 [Seirophora scorigena]